MAKKRPATKNHHDRKTRENKTRKKETPTPSKGKREAGATPASTSKSKTSHKARPLSLPRIRLLQNWSGTLVFVLVCFLLLYPPYLRGLFFDKELLPTHVITALIYGTVWVDKFRRRDTRFIQNPLDYAVLAYAGAYLLSLIGAVHIGDAIKGFLKALNYFMIYWMVREVVRDYRRFETALQVLFASAVGVAAIGIAAATGYSHYPGAFENGHILSTLQYHNTTAVFVGVGTILGVLLWMRSPSVLGRIIYGIAASMTALVAVAAISKGGWVVLALGAVLFLSGMPGLYRLRALYCLGGAMAAAVVGSIDFTPAIAGGNNAMAFRSLALVAVIAAALELVWLGLTVIYQRTGKKVVGAVVILVFIAAATQIPYGSLNIEQFLPTSIVSEAKEVGDVANFSYVSRMEFNLTALRIVKDNPVFGTGAGGWNALYHQYLGFPYWTTEVHNHFLQVWVEAGTLGFLAFVAMWLLLMYNLWRLYQARPVREDWALNWGVASAALALGAHSAIDFDLSLAAVAFVLWALFALVASGAGLSSPGTRVRTKEPAWLTALAVTLAFALLIPAASFARANTWAEKGAQAANTNRFDQAEETFHRAISLNPWDGRFNAYLAKVCAVKFKILTENKHPQAGIYLTETRKHAKDSERLRPHDLQNLKELLHAYSLVGDPEGQIHILEQILKTNPLDPANYLNLADAYLTVGKYYLDQKKLVQARKYLEKIAPVSQQLDHKIAEARTAYPRQSASFKRPPELDDKVEQACSLLTKAESSG